MVEEVVDPRFVGFREFDARVRPLELQVAVISAGLADIPRRQTELEASVAAMRAQQAEIIAVLREMRRHTEAEEARKDDPIHGLTAAVHRLLDERDRESDRKPSDVLQGMVQNAWGVAKVLALIIVVLIGGKEVVGVLG